MVSGESGIRATIIERDNRLGGVIKTDYIEGCIAEAGPDSFITAKPAARNWPKSLDSEPTLSAPTMISARHSFGAAADWSSCPMA